jgi:hypothetical protein
MLLADVFFDVRMFGEIHWFAIIGQTKSFIYGYTRILSPHHPMSVSCACTAHTHAVEPFI